MNSPSNKNTQENEKFAFSDVSSVSKVPPSITSQMLEKLRSITQSRDNSATLPKIKVNLSTIKHDGQFDEGNEDEDMLRCGS